MPSRNEHIYSTRVLPADLEEIRTCLKANEKNRATAPLALGLTQQKESLRYQHAMETAEQKLVCRLKELFAIDSSKHYSICGLEVTRTALGNNEEPIPTILGHVCHFVVLASKYLELAPRYQLLYKLSRSVIQDNVTTTSAAVCLPLYRKVMKSKIHKLNRNFRTMNVAGMNRQWSFWFPVISLLTELDLNLVMQMSNKCSL